MQSFGAVFLYPAKIYYVYRIALHFSCAFVYDLSKVYCNADVAPRMSHIETHIFSYETTMQQEKLFWNVSVETDKL